MRQSSSGSLKRLLWPSLEDISAPVAETAPKPGQLLVRGLLTGVALGVVTVMIGLRYGLVAP